MVAVHTSVAIVLVIALIIKGRIDPVISLVLGSLYLGLAAGVGFAGTVEAITTGFGGIMAEVGLLIGFGVLIGSLLHSTGAFRRLVGQLVQRVGPGRLPYALTSMLAVVMPSIYVDVQVVLAAPVARSASPYIGRTGLPVLASALGCGIFAGYVFVIPGLAAISIAGLLDIRLGDWLVLGVVIGLVTALVSTLLMRVLFGAGGFWDPATDEEPDEAMLEQEAADRAYLTGEAGSSEEALARTEESASAAEAEDGVRRLPLVVLMLPILVPLLLIAFGAFAELGGWSNAFVAFLGDANVALFVGLLGAYALSRASAGSERTNEAMEDGFHTTGEILLITGVGGSLGAVIEATGLDQVLGDLFRADEGAPVVLSILLAWFIAAVLHLAIGSVSVAAITAAGIIAPILDSLTVSPLVIGLAIASGAMFALQVNSNFFWMFKSLLGLSTKGTLKTLTLVTSVASVVSLPLVMLAAVVA
ncbi:GntP family permease [Nocardioides okcheonensis]|uniref:GntP family permease n=1 Tax=Nocardioides okcheonensis TaxID=2894081 RepID=UPI001E62D2FA|nr:SLC13 family permease [Nocardioides okcheonensis]UFN44993.1 GntP family permease [Nocardioides okcheonensis]